MEELLRRRRNLVRRLTRTRTQIDGHDENPLDIYSVPILEEELEEVGAEMNALADEMMIKCPAYQLETPEEALNGISDRFYDAKVKLRRIAWTIGSRVQNNQDCGPSGGSSGGHGTAITSVKLPKLNVATFSGDMLEWTKFYDLFRSSIHNQPLAGAVKLQYLQDALRGEAAELIRNYQISDDNYIEAWNVLCKRYQNTRELVRCQIKKFNSQSCLNEKSAPGLRSLVDTSTSCILSLKALGRKITVDDENDWVVFGIMERLDRDTRELWEAKLGRNVMPKLTDLLEFLDDRLSYLTSSSSDESNTKDGSATTKAAGTAGVKKQAVAHQTNVQMKCLHCDADHMIYNCPEFLKMSVDQRRQRVQEKKLCFNCLEFGHSAFRCSGHGKCKVCKRNHNSLLHIDEPKPVSASAPPSAVAHMANGVPNRALLATAYVPVKDLDGNLHYFRALLDAGADVSFISEDAVQILRLRKRPTEVSINGLGANSVMTARGLVTLELKSDLESQFSLQIEAFVVKPVTIDLPRAPLSQVEMDIFKDVALADPYYAMPGKIDMLLGADVFFDILRAGRVGDKAGLPVGQETVWGYIIGGSCPSQAMAHAVTVHHANVEEDIAHQMKRFWELEDMPRKKLYTEEEQQCKDHFIATHQRNKRGRYVVQLPFRKNVPELGSSLQAAVRRLKLMERQLNFKPERKKQYVKFMEEYEKLVHMELVPENEIWTPEGRNYYLPHHPVIKDESTSTKLRVVFDASAKTTSKISLNDRLMTGPKLQDDLFTILFRFRMYLYVLKADVVKMYRQIGIYLPDCTFQRIVWRASPEESIKVYRLLTVTYGTSVAPYLAKRCLLQLTFDEAESMPDACEIASSDFYMDDLMTGASTLQEVADMQEQLQILLNKGGFELRKWVSNSSDVMAKIPEDMREAQVPFCIDSDDSVKTLGIVWLPASDTFKFKVTVPDQPISSKRQVSSSISKLFDPLGWLSPVTIRAKIILQDLWKLKCEWDEKMPEEIIKNWEAYQDTLKDIETISIPRCVYDKANRPYQIFGFSDASVKAYAAVVYIRTTYPDGTVTVNMVVAKAKPAPIEQVTLPRLELCGTVLLARLIDAILALVKIKPESIHAWTDSTIVLECLKGHPSDWDTFVGNRVAEVQGTISRPFWHHVAGVENPADCASRGITPGELRDHSLWWNGPTWLTTFSLTDSYREEYEVNEDVVKAEQRRKAVVFYTISDAEFPMLHRFSSLPKFLRITAYVLRFIANAKVKKSHRNLRRISMQDITDAMNFWILKIQRIIFAEEFEFLTKMKNVPSSSKLNSLNPFIDEIGIVRVGGRLRNAKISAAKKYPIILPKKSKLIELLIRHEHNINLHAGPQLLLATLQRHYWILGARDVIRYWTRKCVVCARHKAETVSQMMGDLPSWQVNPERPFLRTGVDYAGPIILKAMKGRSKKTIKGYIAIFICFVTKAIHLEVVTDLTSQAFIAALRRFTARRGKCVELISDCGRTFVGAQKELKFLMDKTYQNSLSEKLAKDEGINFRFNPPGAPHFGGLWEAGIKSVKYHLRRVLGSSVLMYEEMETLLTQIEACLNSRPISPMSSDPNDLQPLTPGHFLIGDALTAIPDGASIDTKISRLDRWQLIQRHVHEFWRRWSQEYLTRLQQRPKWCTMKKNVEVGNLVLIKDERIPPLKWKLGRITQLHEGKDKLVRVVTLRTMDGEVTRPVTKLSLLPMENKDN